MLSRRSGGASTFYQFDPQGSVAQRLNSAGAVLSTDMYDAYGGWWSRARCHRDRSSVRPPASPHGSHPTGRKPGRIVGAMEGAKAQGFFTGTAGASP